MNPSQIRILALDVDGTLAARGDEVTPRTREALHHAAASGIEVVIATGRRYRSTQRVIASLGLPVRSVVLGGALVKHHDGRTLRAARFVPDEFSELRELVREAGHAIVCQRDAVTDGGPDFVIDAAPAWNASTAKYFELHGSFGAAHDLSAREAREAIAIGVFGKEAEVRDLARRIAEAHGERFLVSAVPIQRDNDWYFELLPEGVSKWTGLQELAASEAHGPEVICAVGDEVNDLPMIRGAGIGVAMGNAHEAVKDAADWTTGRCDEDGVAEVVERLLAERRA